MSTGTLQHLPDRQLLSRMILVARNERAATIDAVLHLAEIDRRRLYLTLAFSSLFDYCTRHLEYSSSAAGRRIQAARCIRRCPDVLAALRRSEVTLHTVALIAPVITDANRRELLRRVRGKTQREVEAIVAEHKPPVAFRDRVRPVCVRVPAPAVTPLPALAPRSEPEPAPQSAPPRACEKNNFSHSGSDSIEPVVGKSAAGPDTSSPSTGVAGSALPSEADQRAASETPAAIPDATPAAIIEKKLLIQFLADEAFMRKYEEARSLLSNRVGTTSFEAVFGALLDEFVERHSPEKRRKRRVARRAKSTGSVNKKRRQKTETKSPEPSGRTTSTTSPGPSRRTPTAAQPEPSHRTSADVQPEPSHRVSAAVPSALSRQTPAAVPPERSRRIPAAVRDAVFVRDGGRCTYVGSTGRRCGSTHRLQVDHIQPFSRGGPNTPSNLRLLCAWHNRSEAERLLDAHSMTRFRRRE